MFLTLVLGPLTSAKLRVLDKNEFLGSPKRDPQNSIPTKLCSVVLAF